MVRSMRLFKHKFHANGTLSGYKAHLVSNGSSQQLGVDFDETFSPVIKAAIIRTVLSLVVSRQWPIHQLDVQKAFLNSDLSKTVYVHKPPGFVDSRYPHHVCLLQRSLYGLKQVPRAWFQRFASYATRGLFLSQRKYARQLLERAHMVNCNPSQTPVDTDSKLGSEGVPFTRFAFICMIRWSRTLLPSNISCDMFGGTVDFGLQLYVYATTSLVGYIDADWAGCPSTRMSTSGYCVFLGDNLCLGQLNVSTPSLAPVPKLNTVELLTLSSRLHGFAIYCDNVSVVYMSVNPVQHQRTKHIEIDIHFVRDMVTAGQVRVFHVPSRFQYADIFTKRLPSALFEDFRSSLSVRPPHAPTAGAY
ncbi:ribonuclease H-like domain-containing protein [Tanacetum coccineum]